MMSEMEQERGDYALALQNAKTAMQTSIGNSSYLESFISYIEVLYAKQLADVLQGKEGEKELLLQACEQIDQILYLYPSQVVLSHLQLGLALFLDDRPRA